VAILHFHGPKFGFIRAIADGLDWTTNPRKHKVGSLLIGSVPSYLGYLRRCEGDVRGGRGDGWFPNRLARVACGFRA
jgi:hypothetical protein